MKQTSQPTAPPEPRLYLSVKEAAYLIHRSHTEVYRMVRAKELPALKLSKKGDWLIYRPELEEWARKRFEAYQEDNVA